MDAQGNTSASSERAGAGSAQAGPPPAEPAAVPPPPQTEESKPNPAAEAFHRVTADVSELKEYVGYYVAAKIDSVKQKLRMIGLYAAAGVVGLIVGGAMLATAAGLILVGIANGLGRLFGGLYWLGDIVAGVVVLGLAGLGVWAMMKKLTGGWRSQTVKKYEERKRSQREQFGHDVVERARED